jgi:hypothetical protein
MAAGMTAIRRLSITVSLVLVAAGGLLIPSMGTATADDGGPGSVKPILECVFHDTGTGTGTGQYDALWGYTNTSTIPVTIPVGSQNSFSPSPADRGQVTTFSPGTHDNVFVVSWSGASDLTWALLHSDTASITSKACGTNPVPIAGSETLTWIVLAVAFVGTAAVIARRTRRDPTASSSAT